MKQVRVVLGRFQPFTLGHLKLATYDKCEHKDCNDLKTVIFVVSTPKEKVDTRHPFSDDVMKKEFDLIKKNYKDKIEDIIYIKSADIVKWGAELVKRDMQAKVWITGTDELAFYQKMAANVDSYQERYPECKGAYADDFYVQEVKRNDTSDDFVSTISGTKVRQALKDDDKQLFAKMMPKGAEQYFDEFKNAVLNAPEPKKKTSKRKVKEGMMSLRNYIFEHLS